nr:hypothetical protein [Kibdelosporangium sp. MJ126-NF4]CEL16359.1 hypothetical protein [Kibdelosporangium sp. MJ126-NF4]CTQ94283.1 hypothetical protein [Kibdelosporangium sp. MJ126-NF4]
MDQEAAKSESLRTGINLGAAAVLFLLLRLFAVTDYDWHTAFAVVHTLDLHDGIAISVGTVMADSVVGGVVLAVLLPLSTARVFRAGEQGARQGEWLVIVLLIAATVAYTVTNHAWWLPISSVVLTALLGWLVRVHRTGRLGEAVGFAVRRVGVIAVVALLCAAAVVRTPWVPLEKIDTTKGPVLGYVMEVSPGYMHVMQAGDRKLHIMLSSDVLAREELIGSH